MRTCNCPSCGANITINDENRDFAFCQYCGAKIMLDDFRSTQRIVDEAKIRQAETDRMIRLRELELEERKQNQRSTLRRTLTIIWLALSLIILLLCIVKWAFQDDFTDAFVMLFYLGGPVIGGGAYLIFKVLPDKETEKMVIQNGGIRFPKHLEPFSEQNYASVEAALRSAGFRNITCVNMHDLMLGVLQKPGKVEKVAIDGTEITSGGKVYYPDASVVITYHGK